MKESSSPDDVTLLALYERMVRIRLFEEKVKELHGLGKLPGFVHTYIGEEAVGVGACSVLRDSDHITSTHRGHGHVIAKGGDVRAMMAEIYGRIDGYCRGKGGSMHIIDIELGILGANGIVGGGIPIATGSGLADSVLGRDGVTVCFFGDGAANQGVFHEALNLSAIWNLPVIYLCEANQFTEYTPTAEVTAGRIYKRAEPFDIPGVEVDGNDVLAVRRAVSAAADRARRGEGPTLIEAITYRHSDHSEGESAYRNPYRTDEEIARWKARDPIPTYRHYLIEEAKIDGAILDEVVERERVRVNMAVEFAEASPLPPAEEVFKDLYA